MGTIAASRHDGGKTPVSQMLKTCSRTDSDVADGNGFHPAQWLNHWIFAETVLVWLRKTEDYSRFGSQRRS